MKSPRHLLVLFGFICQSLSWEGPLLLALNVSIWFFCLGVLRDKLRLPVKYEPVILLLGCVAGFWVCKIAGQTTHFFLGHGLVAIQAVWLLRPLSRREKIYSILIACFHIGVGCTILLDYRFLAILLSALILIPKALQELEIESFEVEVQKVSAGALSYAGIALAMLLFFFIFPRGLVPVLPPRPGTVGPQGGLLDSILDPASGGGPLSGRVILQIEGERLDYLRSHVLSEFDGSRWTSAAQFAVYDVPSEPPRSTSPPPLYRRVRVKNVPFLAKTLPADGHVLAVKGKFFRNPRRSPNDLLRCVTMWSTSDNFYEYWTKPWPLPISLAATQKRRLLAAPAASDRLRNWLDQRVSTATNDLQTARMLESWLQNHFTYRIGAPDLNRLNPLEDFILKKKEGHCERFASALALLLRMRGIPAVVGVGYVPGKPNWISGWHSVRMRDAHAWTEAYFPEIGWVQLDATPRSQLPAGSWEFNDLVDAMDLGWSSLVLNFDQSAQNYLFSEVLKSASGASAFVHQNAMTLFLVLMVLAAIVWTVHRKKSQKPVRPSDPELLIIAVSHFYGQMLGLLSRQGLQRSLDQTPLEFLQVVGKELQVCFEEVDFITRAFCRAYYGGQHLLKPEELKEVEHALSRLQKNLIPKSAAR